MLQSITQCSDSLHDLKQIVTIPLRSNDHVAVTSCVNCAYLLTNLEVQVEQLVQCVCVSLCVWTRTITLNIDL